MFSIFVVCNISLLISRFLSRNFLATSPTGCPEKFEFTNRKMFEFMFGVQFVSD